MIHIKLLGPIKPWIYPDKVAILAKLPDLPGAQEFIIGLAEEYDRIAQLFESLKVKKADQLIGDADLLEAARQPHAISNSGIRHALIKVRPAKDHRRAGRVQNLFSSSLGDYRLTSANQPAREPL